MANGNDNYNDCCEELRTYVNESYYINTININRDELMRFYKLSPHANKRNQPKLLH